VWRRGSLRPSRFVVCAVLPCTNTYALQRAAICKAAGLGPVLFVRPVDQRGIGVDAAVWCVLRTWLCL
jgi:hypothetical protein